MRPTQLLSPSTQMHKEMYEKISLLSCTTIEMRMQKIHDSRYDKLLVWCVHIAKKAAEVAPHLNTAIHHMHLEYL